MSWIVGMVMTDYEYELLNEVRVKDGRFVAAKFNEDPPKDALLKTFEAIALALSLPPKDQR